MDDPLLVRIRDCFGDCDDVGRSASRASSVGRSSMSAFSGRPAIKRMA